MTRDTENVPRKIAAWHNTFACRPTWDEILEIEYVRSRGEINMISSDLENYCWNRGLVHAAEWIARCKRARTFWGGYCDGPFMEEFEKEHGPRSTWITDETRDRFLAIEYRIEEFTLAQKQQELAERRKRLRKPKR